jgi:hypothetical protein
MFQFLKKKIYILNLVAAMFQFFEEKIIYFESDCNYIPVF